MKALYIGADVRVLNVATLALHLRWPDVSPLIATSGEEGLGLIREESPDILLLHPDFSDMTLGRAIQEIREISSVPILVLGRVGDEMEVVTSLELGADDYVRLPCDLTEVMVRVLALLRRAGTSSPRESDQPIKSGRLFINPASYEAYLDNSRIALTSTEFRLLHLLVKNLGTVVAHQTLSRELWGEHTDSSRLVKKYVQRLRRKLGDDAKEPSWIVSIHGVGYRFVGSQPSPELPQPISLH